MPGLGLLINAPAFLILGVEILEVGMEMQLVLMLVVLVLPPLPAVKLLMTPVSTTADNLDLVCALTELPDFVVMHLEIITV